MIESPTIDFAALSPVLAIVTGAVIVLLAGLLPGRFVRDVLVGVLTVIALLAFIGVSVWQLGTNDGVLTVDGTNDLYALRTDDLAMVLNLLFGVAGLAATALAWRATAPREAAQGEFFTLLLTSIAGMAVLVGAQDTVTLFIGFELLSIPLYVLCATEMRRARSLESGLKYLVVGSVGSATLVYGLALLYGATGTTSYAGMARALESQSLVGDPLLLTGIALVIVGLMFKASVAPFHQWTPDVYEGAPTSVTAFMAVATKAAAFGVLLRFFDVALIDAQPDWGMLLAVLATITIVIGNVGALGQSSLKRMLAWSSVAQAGYLLAGVVVASRLGVRATVFYLAVYLLMNIAAFAVVAARERETLLGDHIDSVAGIGGTRTALAVAMTVAMLSLAGMPLTGGFVGKFSLIEATVDGGFAWLGVVIVLGSALSLAYYMRVIAAMWMRPTPAAAPEADGDDDRARALGARSMRRPLLAGGAVDVADRPERRHAELVLVAVVAAVATLLAGIVPGPLFDLARDAAASVGNLL